MNDNEPTRDATHSTDRVIDVMITVAAALFAVGLILLVLSVWPISRRGPSVAEKSMSTDMSPRVQSPTQQTPDNIGAPMSPENK
jgi:hypothetical protein